MEEGCGKGRVGPATGAQGVHFHCVGQSGVSRAEQP